MATLPAVVTIQDLPTGTTLSGTELLEAVQTVGGVAVSIQVPISQIATTAFGALPTGGATGQLLGKASGTNFVTQWVGLSSLLTAGAGLTTSGSTAVVVSLGSAAGLSVLGVTGAATAVPAAIVGTADQVMVINPAGSSAVFGPVNLAATAAVTGVLPAVNMTAVNLAASGPGGVQGILPVPNGGTNTTALTAFGALYGNGSSAIGATAAGTTGFLLTGNGSALAPSFQAFNLGSSLGTGVIGVPNGGTNTSTLTAHAILLGAGSSTLQFAAPATAGNLLIDQGTSANPAFKAVAGDVTISANGTTTIGAAAVTFAKIATTAQGLTNVRLAKSANYTVANTDKGQTIALGGSAFFTLSLATASGYDSNFAITVLNEDVYTGPSTGRGKTIAPNGYTSFILWPGQTIGIFNQNNVWQVSGRARWKQTQAMGAITLFFDPAGSDNNDGLAAGTTNAMHSINQGLTLRAQDSFDMFAQAAPQLTAQLATGTYTGGIHFPGVLVGGAGNATIVLQGQTSNINACIVAGDGVGSPPIALFDGAIMEIKNLKIEDVTAAAGISVALGATLRIESGITLGNIGTGGGLISVSQGGSVIADSGFSVSGNPAGGSGYLLNASDLSYITLQSQTISATGNLAFSTVVNCAQAAVVVLGGTVFTAAAFTVTGQRYAVANGGQILVFGAGTTVIWGNSGGSGTNPSVSPWGLYA